MKRPVNPELRVLRIIACEAIFGKVRQLSNTEAAARDRVAQEMADYAAKAVAESQARVTGLQPSDPDTTTTGAEAQS